MSVCEVGHLRPCPPDCPTLAPTPEQLARWVEMFPWLAEIIADTEGLDTEVTVAVSVGEARALAEYLSRQTAPEGAKEGE